MSEASTRHSDPPDPPLVRPLAPEEWPAAFPLMHLLRPQLDPAAFLPRLQQLVARGYHLAGAFPQPHTPAGLIGWREVQSFSRGGYLHIDDLVVDPAAHRIGLGRALMQYAAAQARAAGLRSLYLDARPTAIPFYQRLGLAPHPSPSMFLDL